MPQVKTVTPEKIQNLRYPVPKSWLRAAGILRGKRKALERHILKVSKEWGRKS